MLHIKAVSPSSLTNFVECKRRWALRYDKDEKLNDSSDAAERGSLLHRTLELFKTPGLYPNKTFEDFVACFKSAPQHENIGERLDVYLSAS